MKGHLHRGALLVYRAIHLLDRDPEELDPHEYGWEESFGLMLPIRNLKLVPDNMLNVCACGGHCDSTRCGCRDRMVKCTVFCHGKKDNQECNNV